MILNSFKSIDRFFKAKSVVFIGGKDIFVPIRELKRRGYKGKIFVVNPTRKKIDNYKCLRKVSDLPLSPDAAFIAVPAKEVILTALEFRLLKHLLDRRGRVQTRDQLLGDVWGYSSEVTTRTVDTHIKRLREKLGPVGDYIQTIRGVGYRFSRNPD